MNVNIKMNREEYIKHISSYHIISIHILKENIIFVAVSNNEPNDFLTNENYKLIFYSPNREDKKYWSSKVALGTTTLVGGGSFIENSAIFISAEGSVFKTVDIDFTRESKIPPPNNDKYFYPIGTKWLQNGHFHVVGHDRNVFRKDGVDNWTHLTNGFQILKDREQDIYFSTIDGFSDDNLYVGGEDGELWNWNGVIWKRIDLPTNEDIGTVLCAADGMVYILLEYSNEVLKGKDSEWEFIKHSKDVDEYEEFENIVWFKDKIHLNSGKLFEIQNNTIVTSELNQHKDAPSYWGSLISVQDGVMVFGETEKMFLYDGINIITLFEK